MRVLLDGLLVDEAEAGFEAGDRGVLLGFGLFETLRARGGAMPMLERHLARLEAGARQLGLPLPECFATLPEDLGALVAQRPEGDLRVRVTMTAGSEGGPSHLQAFAHPYHPGKAAWRAQLATGHPGAASPTAGLKTTSYLPHWLARERARSAGFDEVLLLDAAGRVVEGSFTNCFVVGKDHRIATPSLSCGPLPGVLRAWAIEQLRAWGYPVEETELLPSVCLASQEVFVTNALQGPIPLEWLGDRAFGAPEVAPRLRQAFEAMFPGG